MVCFCKCLRLLHWRQRSESSSLRFFSEVHLRIFLLISSTYSIKYEPRISESICQITVENLYLQTFQTNVVKISFLVYNFKVQMLLWGKQLSSLLHLEIQEHIIKESETRRFCPKKLKKLVGPVELL